MSKISQIELQRKAVANWREWVKANPDAPAYVMPQMFLKKAGDETVVVRGPSLADLEQAKQIEKANEDAIRDLLNGVSNGD